MATIVSKRRSESFNNVLNDLAKRVFGKEPADAIAEGVCLGCNTDVDIDAMHVFRQERYLVCGMCSACQATWLPADVEEYPDRLSRQPARQQKYLDARKKVLLAMSPMSKSFSKKEISEKLGRDIDSSTLNRHLNDLLEDNCIERVWNKGYYGKIRKLKIPEFIRRKNVKDAMPQL